MGVVYAAEDDRLGRQVALKFVPEELAKDRQAIDRLRSEARTASSLNHPNICTIYDIGEYEGRPFIVMELLKGQTLRERLTAGPLKIHDAVELGIHVADALDSAHHRGIMHRDIKPANLFLVERGQVKILDFGLAKLVRPPHASTTTQSTRDHTAEGVTLGTVSYMSPEQVTGEPLDGRTDLFSLGVVLYECLTGHQPFTGKTSAVIFSAILTRAPVAPVVFNPEMPLRLQEVINNCLEKDRELRYQDAAGLRADLKRVKRDLESGHSGVFRIGGTAANTTAAFGSGQQLVHHDSDSRSTHEQSGQTRQPSVTAIAAAVFVGVALAIVVSLVVWQRTRPTPAPATAGTSQNFVRSRVGLATTSLDAKDYRAAVAYADEALRVAPDDADAKRIHEAAQAMLARFDQAVAQGRQRLAAGDPDGASAAINEARSIEPGAAVVGELSTALVTLLRTQAETARRDAQNSRSAPPPPPSRQGASEQARLEAGRRDVRGSSAAPHVPERPGPTPSPTTTPTPAPAASPPQPTPSPPQPTPQPTPPPQPTPAPAAPAVAPAPARPAPEPPSSSGASTPAPSTSEPTERREAGARGSSPNPENDEAVIRRVVQNYGRAIESKDIDMFRRVKPNMSSDEQRRIEEGFRAVSSQQVNITILAVEIHGQDASVRLRRRDTIQAGGRQQTTESLQTMTLVRSGSSWVIREIGR
jgi:predicted Ser/Thr protein kinase